MLDAERPASIIDLWLVRQSRSVLAIPIAIVILICHSPPLSRWRRGLRQGHAEGFRYLAPAPAPEAGPGYDYDYECEGENVFSRAKSCDGASGQRYQECRVTLVAFRRKALGMSLLDAATIRSRRATVPEWRVRRAVLSRTFEFADFVAALRFVNAVGRAAEEANHHPDIDIRWNRVTLALTTHDAGGLTELDFTLARRCDVLAQPKP